MTDTRDVFAEPGTPISDAGYNNELSLHTVEEINSYEHTPSKYYLLTPKDPKHKFKGVVFQDAKEEYIWYETFLIRDDGTSHWFSIEKVYGLHDARQLFDGWIEEEMTDEDHIERTNHKLDFKIDGEASTDAGK